MTNVFERAYPAVTKWIKIQGWIELGQDSMSRSFVRALDEGGLVWEGGNPDGTVDDALAALDAALERWMQENLGV